MVFTYQNIIDKLPVSYRDYIQNSNEWISLINQSIRRASCNSRRFTALRTNAPLPLEISSQPLVRKEEGLLTYDETYTLCPDENDKNSDFSIENGIREWTNGARFFNVEPKNYNGIRFSLYENQFLDAGYTKDDFNSIVNKDCTILLKLLKNIEYVVAKFQKINSEGGYDYVIAPAYLAPIASNSNIKHVIYFAQSENREIDYYFIPQHSIDGIFSRGDTDDYSLIDPIIRYDAQTNIFNVTNWVGGDLSEPMLNILKASIEWENAESFSIPLTNVASGLLFVAAALDSTGQATGRDIRIYADYGITYGVINADDQFMLKEYCLADPILENLIRLECKKAVNEFIEDTTPSGIQYTIELNKEIEAELRRTAKTLHTPISKLNSSVQISKPSNILLNSR
jgi:hypothetical protein